MSKGPILVIGSTNVDFIIKTDQLPKIGETVTDGAFEQTFGGKGANQAVAAAKCGVPVEFVSHVGNDIYGEAVTANYRSLGLDTKSIKRIDSVSTGVALVMIGNNGENYLSVAPGANYKYSNEDIEGYRPFIESCSYLILQLEIPLEATYKILDYAKTAQKKVIFNLAPARIIDKSHLNGIFACVVNETEAAMISGIEVKDVESAERSADYFLGLGVENCIVTLGAMGSLFLSKDGLRIFTPSFKVKAVDTTAAGDTFCGAFCAALVLDKSYKDALVWATAASALSVSKMGAQPSIPDYKDIEAFLAVQ